MNLYLIICAVVCIYFGYDTLTTRSVKQDIVVQTDDFAKKLGDVTAQIAQLKAHPTTSQDSEWFKERAQERPVALNDSASRHVSRAATSASSSQVLIVKGVSVSSSQPSSFRGSDSKVASSGTAGISSRMNSTANPPVTATRTAQ